MSSDNRLAEADRILRICAACMYCDGLCPVFPSLEGRQGFSKTDVNYLANLCHNCKACWHACQYAPPHPFAVNVPKTLAAARRLSYADHVWPRALGRAFGRPFLGVALAGAAALGAFLLIAIAGGDGAFTSNAQHSRADFYAVAPWALMAGLGTATLLWALISLTVSAIGFWRAIAPAVQPGLLWRALGPALRDIVTLRHLDGGGPGCHDVDISFSRTRRAFHHLMAGGVLLDLASTGTAALYQEILAAMPPYDWASVPVLTGAGGGAAILVGAGGLLALEARADRDPADREEAALNIAFLVLLTIVSASGLALLVWRDTPAMGVLLIFHLSVVLGLFAGLPASKLIHAPFRAAALLRYAAEQRTRERPDRDHARKPEVE